MAATNNITGDEIKTKANSSAYQANYDLIDWNKKEDDSVEKFKPFLAEEIPLNVLGEDE